MGHGTTSFTSRTGWSMASEVMANSTAPRFQEGGQGCKGRAPVLSELRKSLAQALTQSRALLPDILTGGHSTSTISLEAPYALLRPSASFNITCQI